MYFYKKKGKQYLDLTGDVVITHNSDPLKTRSKSAAPAGISGGRYISLQKLNFFRKVYVMFWLAAFVWRSSQELTASKTGLKKPVENCKDCDNPQSRAECDC